MANKTRLNWDYVWISLFIAFLLAAMVYALPYAEKHEKESLYEKCFRQSISMNCEEVRNLGETN